MTNMKQDQEIEEFLNKGLSFEERLLQAGALIREQSKHAYPYNLLDARLCLLSIYYHLIGHWKSNLSTPTNQPISTRMQLILLFFQGVDLTETAISEGQYLKAAAMLQQDLGIVDRLRQLRSEQAESVQILNLKKSSPGMNRFIDHFNTVTSIPIIEFNDSFLKALTPDPSSHITTFPGPDEEAVRGLYELHIRLLFQMVRELMILYTETYNHRFNEEEFLQALDFLYGVVNTLEEIGFRFEKPGGN